MAEARSSHGPERMQLYGRHCEALALCDALHNCWGIERSGLDDAHHDSVAGTVPSHVGLVLVSGSRGVGKRALVETCLRSHQLVRINGLFLSGRCPVQHSTGAALDVEKTEGTVTDPKLVSSRHFNTTCPFRIFQDALERITLCIDSTTLERIRTVVAVQFVEPSSDREILSQVLSSTLVKALLLSPDHEAGEAPFRETWNPQRENEQCGALARFLFVVSTCIPIVLYLEQIQWANSESLQVIEILLQTRWETFSTRTGTKGLLIVASYRDDIETNRADLASFLQKVDTNVDGVRPQIVRLALGNLSRDGVGVWIQETDEIRRSWADVVYDITAGNPLHIQFSLLYLQGTDMKDCLDTDDLEVLRRELPTDIDVLLKLVLTRLPRDLWDVVEIATAISDCVGGSFDYPVLEMVLQRPCAAAVAHLRKCHVLELDGERLRLCRPDVQALAYGMIPESNRATLHLKIGRRMWKNSSVGARDEIDEDGRTLDLVAHQLWRGMHLVTDGEELIVIAAVHLRVGKHAMQASNFYSAVTHFEIAKQALGDKLWSPNCYEMSLMTCNCLAEALYCIGEFDAMEHTLNDILREARTFRDKLQAYNTFVFANGAKHRLKEAVTMALDVLKQLGEPIVENPTSLQVAWEYWSVRRLMRGKKDRYFLSLPAATNADKIAAIQMLNFTFLYSYIINPQCGAMAVFRMLRLTIRHGMTGPGCAAFSAYGLLLNGFGRIQESYRFGQIALGLLDKCDGKAWVPRIYFVVYGLIFPFFCPVRDSLEPLQFAHQSALTTGDIEGSVSTASAYLSLSFHSGVTLDKMERDAMAYCTLMESMGQTLGLIFMVPLWQAICNFSEASVLALNLVGSVTDANSARDQAAKEGNRSALSMYYGMEAICCCYFGEYAMSFEMAVKSWECISEEDYHLSFYHGLAAFALARNDVCLTMWRRRKLVSVGRFAVRELKKWARLCSANTLNKLHLLEAEWAAVRGNIQKALLLYNESIKQANIEGFLHEEGLAYERLAHYHCSLGHSHTAGPYFECARDVYEKWGAKALVRRVDALLVDLPRRT